MSIGAPPLGVSERVIQQFEETDRLFSRLLVEVAHNPSFQDTALCNRRQVLETYEKEWQPYAKLWRASLWDSFDRASEEDLNALTGRANGWAQSCFGLKPQQQVKGHDVEVERPTATWVDQTAPGGAPPRPGQGILGMKKSSLLLAGVALVTVAGIWKVLS